MFSFEGVLEDKNDHSLGRIGRTLAIAQLQSFRDLNIYSSVKHVQQNCIILVVNET